MRMLTGCLLLLLHCLAGVAAAQTGPAQGALLVAEPALTDPSFEHTVVLLLHHGEDGALGLILNRPTEVLAREAIGNAVELGGYNEPIFIGGPVAPAAIAVLAGRAADSVPADSMSAIFDGVYVSSNLEVLADPDLRADAASLRLFAGHAAWQAGQLEREIAGGAWRIIPGNVGHVFTSRPLMLWELLSAVQEEVSARLEPPQSPARP